MDLWYEKNIDELFSDDESIDSVAMNFFSAIGHTCASTVLYSDNDSMHFVYGALATKTILSPSDRTSLLLAKTISLLFKIDGSVFDDARSAAIYYFAVDLAVPKGDRSATASEIQLILARIMKARTVVFFRNESAYMLSFSIKNSDGKENVILSDWLSAGSHDDCFYESLATYNYSFASAKAFYTDFCQAAARQYYIYPCSNEMARYEVLPALLESNENRDLLTRDDIADMVRSILLEPIKEYGDDYIDDVSLIAYASDDSEDTDFDLLEYELEQMGVFDEDFQDIPFEDEAELTAQSSIAPHSQIDSASIPDEIIRDPVKLLTWLESHCKDHEEEVTNEPVSREVVSSEDLLIEALELEDLDYIDNRNKGGVFWIIGGREIASLISDLSSKLGYVFTYKAGGGRATTGEDAWWTK